MKTLIKKIAPWFIFIGLIGWAFGLTYTGLSIVHQDTIQYGTYTWNFFRIDTSQYLQSIEHSLTDNAIINIVPTTPGLPQAPNWTDILSILKFAFNTLFIWVFNCIIYALNWVILAPIKIVLYPVNIIYAIMGLNTASNDWIQATIMLYNFEIPLIPAI